MYRLAQGILFAATCWLFLWNLGANSISLRSDEVIYVRVTQSILHNGDLFPLKHGSAPTYEKPPLKLWLASIAPLIFGESNFSFRLLDGVLGILAVILTAQIMRIISGSAWLGLLAGALLLGMPELVIFHHSYRRAVLDGLLSVLTLLAALGSWRILKLQDSSADAKWQAWGVGALCAAAVLTKSVAGFVPAICAVVALILCAPGRRVGFLRRILTDRALLRILAPPVLVFTLYCAALWGHAGVKGLNIFIGVEIVTRTVAGFKGHNTSNQWFYLWSLFVRGASVPKVLLAFGLSGAILGVLRDRSLRFLLVWGCLPVLLYSLAASKVPWYLNPFLPFISMLSVAGTRYLFRVLAQRFNLASAAGLVFAVTLFSLPAYRRAVIRHFSVVNADTERIAIDPFIAALRSEYSEFVIIENAISGRSNPHNGRFNVEGIYREMLKPGLRAVPKIEEYQPRQGEVALVRDDLLSQLPIGWRKVASLEPFADRSWVVVGVVY